MSKIENVLVVPKEAIVSAGLDMPLSTFYEILETKGRFYNRSDAEVDENFLQIIPYCAIYRFTDKMREPSMFLYQRLKGGSESRLHAKFSIGIGGHITKEEDGEIIDRQIVTKSAIREIREEIGDKIHSPIVGRKNFLIYDDSNPVGKVHLGVCMRAWATTDNVDALERDKIFGEMTPISIIKTDKSIQLENWSQMAMNLWLSTNQPSRV
jgi:predicted NUDIX family phosphoesterase